MGNYLPWPFKNAPSSGQQPDLIEQAIGSFGRYQLFIAFLMFLCKFPIALNQMAIIFLQPKVSYTCEEGGALNECPCPNPIWDTSVFTRTIQSEWNLICGKRALGSVSQSLFQLGVLLGSILFGMASDRFGRRRPLLIAVIFQMVFGLIASFANSFELFTFSRMIVGACSGGTMVVTFVILMEFTGTKYRSTVAVLYQMPFNVGLMLLPLVAYFIRDYRYFQLAISMPSLLQLLYFFFVPETPRWLIAAKRTEDAVKLMEKVAKRNKRPIAPVRGYVLAFKAEAERNKLKSGTVVDLFRTPNLRRNILAMSVNWFGCSYFFYGINHYMGQLSGDVFINVLCSTSVSLVGTIISFPFLKFFGRKTVIIINMWICFVAMIVLTLIPRGNVAEVVCSCVGSIASFTIFTIVYLHCTEMFPTVVRNAALGFSSMIARVGSMLAPLVIELNHIAVWLPPLIFSIPMFIGGLTSLLLPETAGCELATTLEEGEAFKGRKKQEPTKPQ